MLFTTLPCDQCHTNRVHEVTDRAVERRYYNINETQLAEMEFKMIISSLLAQLVTQFDAQSLLLFQQVIILMAFAKFIDSKF